MVVSKTLTVRFDLFHLKWISQDRQSDYDSLAPDQYINHFQNHKEITSKSFLKRNLETFHDGDLQLFDYFPRAYDLSFPQQSRSLLKDYFTNTIFCILKKTLLYCEVQYQDRWFLVEHEKYRIEKSICEHVTLKDRLWHDRMKPSIVLVA